VVPYLWGVQSVKIVSLRFFTPKNARFLFFNPLLFQAIYLRTVVARNRSCAALRFPLHSALSFRYLFLFSPLVLSLAAFKSDLSTDGIKKALEETKVHDIKTWTLENLSSSLFKKRIHAFYFT
jgi:hypothetical protein